MSESGQLTPNPTNPTNPATPKPFIISITGSTLEINAAISHLLELQLHPQNWRWKPDGGYDDLEMMLEINLSCPNIHGRPPPAYDEGELYEYITAIANAKAETPGRLHVGIKTPPYTYAGQFTILQRVMEASTLLPGGCPVSFITACNTLGSCLVMDAEGKDALGSANGMGIGGMAGDALHPLALGNVKLIREILDESACVELKRVVVIGIGGVSDAAGFGRMRKAGAGVVGVGTALGREGVDVFEKIANGLKGKE